MPIQMVLMMTVAKSRMVINIPKGADEDDNPKGTDDDDSQKQSD